MFPLCLLKTYLLRDCEYETEAEAFVLSAAEYRGETFILIRLPEDEDDDDDPAPADAEEVCVLRLCDQEAAFALMEDGKILTFADAPEDREQEAVTGLLLAQLN